MAFELKDGQGSLFKNDKKKDNPKAPDYRGEVNICGNLLSISAWIKEGRKGKFMSLSFQPKRDRQQQPAAAGYSADSEPPF